MDGPPVLDIISISNVYAGSAIAIFLNFILLLAVFKSKTLSKSYQMMIDANAILCIIYAIVNVLANPSFAAISEKQVFLIVKGGISTPYIVGIYLLLIYILLVIVTSAQPCVQFFHRYLHIVHYDKVQSWSLYQILFYFFFVLLYFFSATYLCWHLYPTPAEIRMFNETVYHINIVGYAPFLVGNMRFIDSTKPSAKSGYDFHNVMALTLSLCLMFLSTIFGMSLAIAITRYLKHGSFSERTLQLQQQLQRTLIAQATIPFATIQIPFYVCFLAPSLGINMDFLSNYVPLLITYYPVLSPLTVLFYCKDIHRLSLAIVTRIFRKERSSTMSVIPTVSRH